MRSPDGKEALLVQSTKDEGTKVAFEMSAG